MARFALMSDLALLGWRPLEAHQRALRSRRTSRPAAAVGFPVPRAIKAAALRMIPNKVGTSTIFLRTLGAGLSADPFHGRLCDRQSPGLFHREEQFQTTGSEGILSKST
jgi:hypothetical protein